MIVIEPSVVSDDTTGITTLAVGSEVKTTENVAGVPFSSVLPEIADTVTLATSSSVLTTAISENSILL